MGENYESVILYPFWDTTDLGFYKFRQILIDSHWNAQEVANDNKMAGDVEYMKIAPEPIKKHIKSIIFFFSIGDEAILDFIPNLVNRITDNSWRSYEFQKIAQEDIHAETYRKQFEYIAPNEIIEYCENKQKYNFLKRKISWCEYIFRKQNPSLAKIVYVFIILELLFFSSSFAAIFWYKEQDKFHGLAFGNELIARDESTHGECGIYAYNNMNNKLSEKKIHKIMSDAVEIECEFADEITPVEVGINAEMMRQHVQSIADYILIKTGYKPLYNNKPTPFDFMIKYGMERRTDFFRKKNSNYRSYEKKQFKYEKVDF